MHPSVFSEKYGVVGDEQATTRKWRWRSVLHRGRRGRKVAARGGGKKGEARVCRGLEEIKRGGGVVGWWRRSVT
jgi:hypothetical protein